MNSPSFVQGAPRALLRLENAAIFGLSLAAYAHLGGGVGTFATWFLVPDVAMLGYLVGKRAGASAYNTSHTYLGPALLASVAVATGHSFLLLLSLVWSAHVGFDRMLGYGLKYPHAFGATHLGQLGHRSHLSNAGRFGAAHADAHAERGDAPSAPSC